MLNPKYQRFADRIEELIKEGKHIATLERPSRVINRDGYIEGDDMIQVHEWLTKTRNILETVFGRQSPQHRDFEEVLPEDGIKQVKQSLDVYPIVGVLQGALSDLKNGYLLGREFFIVGEVFDSILEQAKHFIKTGNKDIAAILARIVLEDALKRLARSEGIDDSFKASKINDELKNKERYPQVRWRSVQTWLDVGNDAAHGRFNEYTKEDVASAVGGIEHFLALEFQV